MGAIFLVSLCTQVRWNDILTGEVCRQDVRNALILLLFALEPPPVGDPPVSLKNFYYFSLSRNNRGFPWSF